MIKEVSQEPLSASEAFSTCGLVVDASVQERDRPMIGFEAAKKFCDRFIVKYTHLAFGYDYWSSILANREAKLLELSPVARGGLRIDTQK
jgi:hypothetical protein